VAFALPPGFLFGLAVLTRWTPMLFLPAFLSFWIRKRGVHYALLGFAGAVSTVAVALALFLPGSNGNLFRSAGSYAQHWYFFGFAHRILADILALSGWTIEKADSIQLAKAILFAGWLVFIGWFSWFAYRRKWSIWLTSVVTLTSFLIVTPTLHPWYFLPLIVLGVRHEKSLVTPWLWPMLAPLSYFFYFENSDPTSVRLLVYGVVTAALCRDGWRLWKREASPPSRKPLKPRPLLKSQELKIIWRLFCNSQIFSRKKRT
jgi:hypothetical protein